MKALIKGASLVLILLLWVAAAAAHDVLLPVIVDSDAAADDIRAVAMLLNAGEADIRLIVATDGVLRPERGRRFFLNLISCLGKPDIPVVAGTESASSPPAFRKINESLAWPDCAVEAPPKAPSNAAAAIMSALHHAETKVLYLCLGPMTSLAEAMDADPSILSKLYRVVYLGGPPDGDAPGWNTLRDPKAAKRVYDSGAPVYGLGLPDERYLALADVFDKVSEMGSDTARLLVKLHAPAAIEQEIANRHIRIWDEMVIIYVILITGFDFKPVAAHPAAMQLAGYDREAVKGAYIKLLGNPADFHLDKRKPVVLSAFPSDPRMMREDVSPFVQEIITRHGEEEWKACLLTNELHRHLGIYSLVGAKMGIRAREILEVPFDALSVVSHAGLKPPLSCLNDGLQVSTGASLGRGTITVTDENRGPTARFMTKNVALELTLKPAYVARIQEDIRAMIERTGGLGPSYFAGIRALSIRYWKELDRKGLFEERFVRLPVPRSP